MKAFLLSIAGTALLVIALVGVWGFDNKVSSKSSHASATKNQSKPTKKKRSRTKYVVVDTGQAKCYDDRRQIKCPSEGEAFYGQDAQYQRNKPSYKVKRGMVKDRNTGLMWQRKHNSQRLSYYDAKRSCENLDLGGYSDWRLPSVKETYSIADFRGAAGSRFYIDSKYFDMKYPTDLDLGREPTHRVEMMGQTWTSTIYVGDLWGRGQEAAFFFNFFDGRIKSAQTSNRFELFYRCVRGKEYGINKFKDQRNGTVKDKATGLTWQKTDDGKKRDWQGALSYCERLKLGGYNDWRLPNVKELQSIVDYRKDDPAIDTSIFRQRDRNAWFWSSTTLGDRVSQATYVCFGKCVSTEGVDTHGAGAQRSDPKSGDPDDFPPMGGQRDEVRINNCARCVRRK